MSVLYQQEHGRVFCSSALARRDTGSNTSYNRVSSVSIESDNTSKAELPTHLSCFCLLCAGTFKHLIQVDRVKEWKIK